MINLMQVNESMLVVKNTLQLKKASPDLLAHSLALQGKKLQM